MPGWQSPVGLLEETHQPPFGPSPPPLAGAGDTDLELLVVLNNATYQSISISGWMAANPGLLLSTNFGVPESIFAKFPKDEVAMPEEK